METITQPTLRQRFDALPDHAKSEIIGRFGHINVVDDDWYGFVREEFVAEMAKIGVIVYDIHFSGFCSQGDGACFEGRVYEWDVFLKSLGLDNAALIKHAEDHWRFVSTHNNRYSHHKSVTYDADLALPASGDDSDFAGGYSPYESDSLQETVWMLELSKFNEKELHAQFKDVFEEHMMGLYVRLESEYEELISYESILGTLEDCEEIFEEAITNALEKEHA